LLKKSWIIIPHFDCPPGADGFIRCQDDPQAIDRVIHVVAEILIRLDGPEQEALLEFTQCVVVGLAVHVDDLVALGKATVRIQCGMVYAQGFDKPLRFTRMTQ